MTLSNHSWEEETRRHLAQVRAELNKAIQDSEQAKARVEALGHEAQAFELALQSHLRRTGRQQTIEHDMRETLMSQMNHEDRLKKIAERNGGLIKVGAAADILYNYQIIKSKSRMNAYRIVYGLLLNLVSRDIFEKVGAAEFRLVGSQAKLPT